MPIKIDYLEYHKSLARELRATKNRVRNLIGNAHWLKEGEYKEAILRRILSAHLPESVRVGSGFVCYSDHTSTQIDIMVISKSKPTLFGDESLFFVTPDAVEAIIEVKTSQKISELRDSLNKLAKNVADIRNNGNSRCKAGLFAYEDKTNNGDDVVLSTLFNSAEKNPERAINWVSFGPKRFFRFWSKGLDGDNLCNGPRWHSYELKDGLAHAYFVSNVVWDTTHDKDLNTPYAWFPIEGGKQKKWCISLYGPKPTQF